MALINPSSYHHTSFYLSLDKLHINILESSLETHFFYNESYLFSGDFGTGKTHHAILLMRDYLNQVFPRGFLLKHYREIPVFIKFTELVKAIDESVGIDAERKYFAKEILSNIMEAPFLVIDDLDIIKSTDYREQNLKQWMYLFADDRYNNQKHFIITTNLDAQRFADFYDAKVLDRLLGSCQIAKFKGKSKRF